MCVLVLDTVEHMLVFKIYMLDFAYKVNFFRYY
jgi:hypothetical protein